MPTFCRHGRFLERCPICGKDLPGSKSPGRTPRSATGSGRPPATAGKSSPSRKRGGGLRVRHEGRAAGDRYGSALLPGLRASADAERLAEEIAFSSGRLGVLALDPPGLYGEARRLSETDIERASWICFVIAYLGPLEGEDPFHGVRALLEQVPDLAHVRTGEIELDAIALGPSTSHAPNRGKGTLVAYAEWVLRGGHPLAASSAQSTVSSGRQAEAFIGDPDWSPPRRFDRLFERLALPGLHRRARFELLVTMGRLGLYELQAGSLHLGVARGTSVENPATTAAKRVFGIGDPLLLERRARALADAVAVPLEALDLALENWVSPRRATMGVASEVRDEGALQRAREALGL
jgi:hypothetical protein